MRDIAALMPEIDMLVGVGRDVLDGRLLGEA
jgi:hypothetical protein